MRPDFTPKEGFQINPFIFSSNSTLEGCENAFYNNLSDGIKALYAVIALISMVLSSFVALTIFYYPKLRIHPSKLIGYMAMCEAISCFNALVYAVGA